SRHRRPGRPRRTGGARLLQPIVRAGHSRVPDATPGGGRVPRVRDGTPGGGRDTRVRDGTPGGGRDPRVPDGTAGRPGGCARRPRGTRGTVAQRSVRYRTSAPAPGRPQSGPATSTAVPSPVSTQATSAGSPSNRARSTVSTVAG